jgi:hypothetical protein
MNIRKIAAIVLIALGVLAIVYPRFSVPTERKKATIGPLEFSVQKEEEVQVPTWAGVAAIVVGAGLLVVGRGGRS